MSTIKTEASTNAKPRRHWSQRLDRLINLFKWPSAFAMAAATPFLAWALVRLAFRVILSPWSILPFLVGAIVFILLWRRVLGKTRLGRFMITFEHESTHALFAILTLHRIVGFRASLGRGGEVRFTGKGNWLIAVAPYFFPTAALAMFLIAYFLPFPGLPWQSFLLGVALGYHIVSTYRETHRDQTDIHSLGETFCWLFLPAANLAVVGLLVSFAHGSSAGTQQWLSSMQEPVQILWQHLVAQ